MSDENKPRIYGFCDAGCKWRVAHYSDIEGAAAMLPISADENGNYVIGVGEYCRFDIGVDPVSVLCEIGAGAHTWQVELTSDAFHGEFRGDSYYGAEVCLLQAFRLHHSQQQPPRVEIVAIVEMAGHNYFNTAPMLGEVPCKRFRYTVANVPTNGMTDEELSSLLYDNLRCRLIVSAGDENYPIKRAHKLNKNATLEIKAEGGITVTHDGAGNVTLN